MRKIVRQGVNVEKLAQKLHKKKGRKKTTYTLGNPEEKVWINFQDTKKHKRLFADTCKKNGVNASSFLRSCVKAFITSDGNVSSLLKALKSVAGEDNLGQPENVVEN